MASDYRIINDGEGQAKIDLKGINKKSSKNVKKGIDDTNYIFRGSKEEKDEIKKLMKAYDKECLNLTDFYNSGNAWLLDQSEDSMSEQMRLMNRMFNRRMLTLCMAPLSEGLQSDAILESVGMFIGYYAASPDARKYVKDLAKEKLVKRIDDGCKKGGLMGGFYSSSFMREKKEKYEKALHNGRVPFTEESAALTDIAIKKEYYNKLRSGDYENKEDLRRQYDKANKVLDDLMIADGLDRNDVRKKRNVMIGRLMREDPTVENMFSGFLNGDIKKAPYHKEELLNYDEYGTPSVEEIKIWTGEFSEKYINEEGNIKRRVSNNIDFIPREPIKEDELFKKMSDLTSVYVANKMKSGEFENEIDFRDEYVDVLRQSMYDGCGVVNVFEDKYDKNLSKDGLFFKKNLSEYLKVAHNEDGMSPVNIMKNMSDAVSYTNIDMNNKYLYHKFGDKGFAYSKLCFDTAKNTYDIEMDSKCKGMLDTKLFGCVAKTYGFTSLKDAKDKNINKDYTKMFDEYNELREVCKSYRSSFRNIASYYPDNIDKAISDLTKYEKKVSKENMNHLKINKTQAKNYNETVKYISGVFENTDKFKDFYKNKKVDLKIKDFNYEKDSHLNYKKNPIFSKSFKNEKHKTNNFSNFKERKDDYEYER